MEGQCERAGVTETIGRDRFYPSVREIASTIVSIIVSERSVRARLAVWLCPKPVAPSISPASAVTPRVTK
jgi:hypothetical protein